jgi:hypothetical protein
LPGNERVLANPSAQRLAILATKKFLNHCRLVTQFKKHPGVCKAALLWRKISHHLPTNPQSPGFVARYHIEKVAAT